VRALARLSLFSAAGAVCFGAGVWLATRRPPAAGTTPILYYQDPMHPGYRSDRPGTAPDCGMQLEAVYAGDERRIPARPAAIRVTADRQQAIGIATAVVARSPGPQIVRTTGRVAADEMRFSQVNAAAKGWIRQTFPNTVGSLVSKDQPLASFYSPEFLPAEQALIYGLSAIDRAGGNLDQVRLGGANLQATVDTLRNLGMGDLQIDELKRTRQITQDIVIRAPVTGFVTARNVSPGLRFEAGAELYRFVDLRTVWILADLFGKEATFIRPRQRARVTVPDQDGAFTAIVSDVLPIFDPLARTFKIRLEADNPHYALRPEMFVDVEFSIDPPAGLTIPAAAVIDSGTRQTVFVAAGDGYFEPRAIRIGWRAGDRVEVTRGLSDGERIVVSGNFLLDAEVRLHAPRETASSGEKDPICGMDVDAAKARAAGHVVERDGTAYLFCSADCKRRFAASAP
jgi:membrane fusion protein, copper/silver efflux system